MPLTKKKLGYLNHASGKKEGESWIPPQPPDFNHGLFLKAWGTSRFLCRLTYSKNQNWPSLVMLLSSMTWWLSTRCLQIWNIASAWGFLQQQKTLNTKNIIVWNTRASFDTKYPMHITLFCATSFTDKYHNWTLKLPIFYNNLNPMQGSIYSQI